MNEQDSRTARRLKAIEAAITDRALTVNEIAAAIFAVPQSAGEYVRNLMDPENQRIHIERWCRTPGHIVAAYRWGPGKNARKPRAMTSAECERARLKRVRKDAEAYELMLQKSRARYARQKAVKAPNSWFAGLPGAHP